MNDDQGEALSISGTLGKPPKLNPTHVCRLRLDARVRTFGSNSRGASHPNPLGILLRV